MNVLVVGAGPAGLLAAWGAFRSERPLNVVIWDRDPVYHHERIFSLQYMHEPCGLPFPKELLLTYESDLCTCTQPAPPDPWQVHETTCPLNCPETEQRQHAKLLYNTKLKRPPEEENSTRFLFETPVKVWSLKDAYAWLYQYFTATRSLQQSEITWEKLLQACQVFDLVINTVPLDRLRPDLEWPVRSGLLALNWLPRDLQENTCLYNLDPSVPWYRATYLDGGKATEFTSRVEEDLGFVTGDRWKDSPPLVALRKVKENDVLETLRKTEFLPSNLVFTGRWGSWNPAALTHHAYYRAKEVVENLG